MTWTPTPGTPEAWNSAIALADLSNVTGALTINSGALGFHAITYGNTGALTVTASNPTDGPGSGNFDGGILTQSLTGVQGGVSYHLAPSDTPNSWGEIWEFVGHRTRDQTTNYQRNSFGGLAAYYGPALNDPVYGGLGAFVINQEAGGNKPRLPFFYMVQTNGDASAYYLNQALYFDANGSAQFFRRLDGLAKAQHGNLEVAIGTNEVELGASFPESTGTYDSPQFRIFGNSRDSFGAHTANWRSFVNVTSNAGASTYRLQSQIDGQGWSDILQLGSAGTVTLNTSGLGDYANDTAAATGGVVVGQLYRNGSVLMIRVS